MNERPSSQRPRPGRRSLPARRAGERRVLWIGLLLSLGAHIVLIGVVGGWLDPGPDQSAPRTEPVVAEPPRGLRVVQLTVPEAGDPLDEPAEPEPSPEPESSEEREEEREPVVARVESEPGVAADTLSAADRLAPRVVDPRLWRPMVLLPPEPTIEDVEARVAAAMELLSDSALAEAEAALRARDWTVEDADGGRWGISPGQLHLGDVTLPLPIWFPVSADARAENQQWYELEQQLDRARILESFQTRVEAIRERRDREREERRNAENGGG